MITSTRAPLAWRRLNHSKKGPALQRVLVAEDDAATFKVISRLLALAGYSVTWAQDGPMALKLASAYGFDLLLLDICLPGLDGLMVLEALRKCSYRPTPVIAMSAADLSGAQHKLRRLGADAVLAKPFRAADLLATVRQSVSLAA